MKKLTQDEFIEKARKVHGDKYDYSKVEYINNKTKVCIICLEHGEFFIKPNDLLQCHGCPKCIGRNRTTEEFIDMANKKHDGKYKYNKTNYETSNGKIIVTCPIHGDFITTPHSHLNGNGCPKCFEVRRGYKRKYNKEDFIEKANKIHNWKYDYLNTEYIDNRHKVRIICPIHGEFWQTPHEHLDGCGCPICKESHLEREIRILLENNNIGYEYQKRFKWLGLQSLDFYIPDYNIAIECQGEQHYRPVSFSKITNNIDIENLFRKVQKRDNRKKILCAENSIDLLYYANNEEHKSDENTFCTTSDILKYIFNKKK